VRSTMAACSSETAMSRLQRISSETGARSTDLDERLLGARYRRGLDLGMGRFLVVVRRMLAAAWAHAVFSFESTKIGCAGRPGDIAPMDLGRVSHSTTE
jgi:hypothetical protein